MMPSVGDNKSRAIIRRMSRTPSGFLHTGHLAGLVFFLALWLTGAHVPGYEHALHSVGVLGSGRVPGTQAFNAVGYELPGALLAVFALALGRVLRAARMPLAARVGSDVLLISGIAFALQGFLPLDLADPDGPASRRHVLALTLSMLAAVPAMALIAAGLRGRAGWRPLVLAGAAGAVLLALLLAWPPHAWVPGWAGRSGVSQRLALAVYFAFPAIAAAVALRRQPPL